MLEFYSASARMVNSRRAIEECMEAALGAEDRDCDLVLIHASMGHDFAAMADEAKKIAPSARIVGSSGCGVVGCEGVSESMKDVAIMAVRGKGELAVSHVDDIHGANAKEKATALAEQLRAALPEVNMVYLLASGIDIANDLCIEGIESVLGPEVTIFGATSSDTMRGVVSYQIVDDAVLEHGAFLIGFADPTLRVETQATHGFIAVGEPMTVTRAEGHRILELDGQPAWTTYTQRLQVDHDAPLGDTIPIGALAEALSPEHAEEYGNPHILRVVTKTDSEGALYYPTTCAPGTPLWLTVRDETRIFSDTDRMMGQLSERIGGSEVVAVFHADCGARGRMLFGRVMKEELVGRMQHPLSKDGAPPPWLGIYGFGEFARLGGANTYHNYTTSLYVICRDRPE